MRTRRTLLLAAVASVSLASPPVGPSAGAGGKWKSGQHVSGNGDPSSRVGLTIQQVLGMPVSSWGQDAMQTSKPIGEVMA